MKVCAIYSERRKRPKFGVVHVIPFQCLGCPVGVETTDGPLQCGECGRLPLDQSLAKKARKPVSPALTPHTPVSPVFDTTSCKKLSVYLCREKKTKKNLFPVLMRNFRIIKAFPKILRDSFYERKQIAIQLIPGKQQQPQNKLILGV